MKEQTSLENAYQSSLASLSDAEAIRKLFLSMKRDFVSNGGVLSDRDLESLLTMVQERQLYILKNCRSEVVGCASLTIIDGQAGRWGYLSTGYIVHELRSSGAMGILLDHIFADPTNSNLEGYCVLTPSILNGTPNHLFKTRGFTYIDTEIFPKIDTILAEFCEGRIKPEIKTSIYIRLNEREQCYL